MKKQKIKITIAWMILILLFLSTIGLSYLKFFGRPNSNIEERPIENSSSEAIELALKEIVNNFNQNEQLKEYEKQNIQMKATLNNRSIFISYTTEITTTYEFTYDNLTLNIIVQNSTDNLEKFKTVFEFLNKAIQQRINNSEDISQYMINFLDNDIQYEGLWKEEKDTTINYHIDITKKLKEEQKEEINSNNEE